MNIIHVNSSDINGGAARAAHRIHRSLVSHGLPHGVKSQMRTINKISTDPTIIGGPPANQGTIWRHLQPRLSKWARKGFKTENPTLHSIAWPKTNLGIELQQRHFRGQADIIHLHWLDDSTISIEEIGLLPMPLVWTLHDQWAFCGAEHYTNPPFLDESNSRDERFCLGYTPSSRPSHEAGPDLNRKTWRRKYKTWRRPIHIVACSNWIASCAKSSVLMREWPITVIPHPIDLATWAPTDQTQARSLLKLPLNRPLILFGAIGGFSDPRKGSDLLLRAIQLMRSQLDGTPLAEVELVVFGQTESENLSDLGFPMHFMGNLKDDLSLRILYAAADVMVVPSRQEAFGQTALEAQACGTPVAAFQTGGLVDIIDDKVTGALATPFEPQSLSKAIQWILEDPLRRLNLGAEARKRAKRLSDPQHVAKLYCDVYSKASKVI